MVHARHSLADELPCFFSRASCLRDYSPQLHNAYGLLRAARVAVYPINPKGVQGRLWRHGRCHELRSLHAGWSDAGARF